MASFCEICTEQYSGEIAPLRLHCCRHLICEICAVCILNIATSTCPWCHVKWTRRLFQGKNERIDMSKPVVSSANADMDDEVVRIESEKGEYKQYYDERRRIELEQRLKQEEDDFNFAKLILSQEDSTLLNAPSMVISSASQQGVAVAGTPSLNSQVRANNKKTQLSIDVALAVQSSLSKQEGAPSVQSEGAVPISAMSACSGKENAVIKLVDNDKWIQLKPPKARVSLQTNTINTNNTKYTEESSSKRQRNINDYMMPAAVNIIKISDKNRISGSRSSNNTSKASTGSSNNSNNNSSSSSGSSSRGSINNTGKTDNYEVSTPTAWQCHRCTLFNPIHSKVCDACDYMNEDQSHSNAAFSPVAPAKRPRLL